MKLPAILASHPILSAVAAVILAYALFTVARSLVGALIADFASTRARRLRAARLAAATSSAASEENPYFMTKG